MFIDVVTSLVRSRASWILLSNPLDRNLIIEFCELATSSSSSAHPFPIYPLENLRKMSVIRYEVRLFVFDLLWCRRMVVSAICSVDLFVGCAEKKNDNKLIRKKEFAKWN